MTDKATKTTVASPDYQIRITCYIPIAVKKAIHKLRANDPSPNPPPENDYFLQMIGDGMADFQEMPAVTTQYIHRIDFKNRKYFVPFGITMPNSLYSELKEASKQIPQYPVAGHEPVKYRFIDLVACLLNNGMFGG